MSNLTRALFELFRDRFFETGQESAEGGEARFYQTLGLLAVPGLFVAMFLIPGFMELAFQPPGPKVDWFLRQHRLFFPTYSFAVVGFATFLEWDRLFPTRQDFLLLTPFPIPIRALFLAKLATLGRFLGLIFIAANAVAVVLMPVFSAWVKQARMAGVLRLGFAQIVATALAALFAFFLVAAGQGILINILSPRLFRRVSPWLQMTGMSAMVLCLLLFPVWSAGMQPLALARPDLLRWFPLYWFVGIYDFLLPTHSPLFEALGLFGLECLAVAIGIFAVGWFLGFAHYCRRTLESEDLRPPTVRQNFTLPVISRILSNPLERGLFHFAAATLARSVRHKLFLTTYLSAGFSFALLSAISVGPSGVIISRDGFRTVPFLLTFFVLSGLRAAFQFPAELASNWLFQLSATSTREAGRRATRLLVIVAGLLPLLALFLPLNVWFWGWNLALQHLAIEAVAGLLLTEILFWNLDQVPFTCSWFPGATNLAVLVGLHLYGFTGYSYRMGDLEARLDHSPLELALVLAVGVAALTFSWRRQAAADPVRYSGEDAELQILDLT